jgi:hypothetical protein
MLQYKKVSFVLIGFLFITCSEKSTDPNKIIVEIDLPAQKMAVYADAVYIVRNDSLILNTLQMSSIIFTEQTISNDTTYLNATVTEYIPEIFAGYGTSQGTLKLSKTDKWIAVEQENNVSSTFLYKSSADSTKVPTRNFLHNTVYPGILVEGEESDIFRPSGDFSAAVYKKFRVGREINWDDSFGYATGLYLETQSTFSINDTLYTTAIYDEHGLIVSQYTLDLIIWDGFNNVIDSVRVHNISRRISDYGNPLLKRELSYYADQVLQSDLRPIYR